jgi:hypothetical protein
MCETARPQLAKADTEFHPQAGRKQIIGEDASRSVACQSASNFGSDSLLMQFEGCLAL